MEAKIMRVNLANLKSDKRYCFTGVVDRYGARNGWRGPIPTILLKDIRLAADGFFDFREMDFRLEYPSKAAIQKGKGEIK
jgi:hypothetical protein